MHLADQPHIGSPTHRDVGIRHACRVQGRPGFRFQLIQHGPHQIGIELVGRQQGGLRAHTLHAQRCCQKTKRGSSTARRRDDQFGHPQNSGNTGGMGGAGAAKPDHGIATRIAPLLDDMGARSLRHILVHDRMNTPGSLDRAETHRRAQFCQGRLGSLPIEAHPTAQKIARVQIAQKKIGVGHGRPLAATPIAGRTRCRPGAVRADLQQPELINLGNRAATGPDLHHVDDRRLDRQPGAGLETMHARRFHRRCDIGATILDQTGLGSRPTHVEGQHVRKPGLLSEQSSRQPTPGRPRLQKPDRKSAGHFGAGQCAGALHQHQASLEPAGGQFVLKPLQIARHQRLDISIGAGRHRALVFAHFADHGRGERYGKTREIARRHLPHRSLMRGIGIRVQKTHRNRLNPLSNERRQTGACRLQIERGENGSIDQDPFPHLHPALTRCQHLRKAQKQVVDVVSLLFAHFQGVTKPLRGQQT